MKTKITPLAFLCCAAMSAPLFARQWTDDSGKFTVDADLVTFNDRTVVLKEDNHDLIAVPLAKLSKADQDYIASQEVQDAAQKDASEFQTWMFLSGLKAVGRVVDYGRKDVVVQRRRGKVYVNDRLFDNLPEFYQRLVPQIVSHFEKIPIDGKKQLEEWAVKQKGEPRTFTCEGVLLQLENGDEYGVPFFFFSDEDLKILKPGWEKWAAADKDAAEKQRQAFYLESLAQAYQHDRQVSQQIAAFDAMKDYYDLWTVQLVPQQGVAGGPISVTVPARNSSQAKEVAVARNPGYFPGAVAKVRRLYN